MTYFKRHQSIRFGFPCTLALVGVIICFSLVSGCKRELPKQASSTSATDKEPRYIAVQHILIGYKNSVQGREIERTKEESEVLAAEVFKLAKSGQDFDELVERFSDDYTPPEEADDGETESSKKTNEPADSQEAAPEGDRTDDSVGDATADEQDAFAKYRRPGIYRISNFQSYTIGGSLPHLRIYGRKELVPGFGDLAFSLEVGEIGFVELDRSRSPFGWHVIKRIE